MKRTPLRRSAQLRRYTEIRRINHERIARLRAEAFGERAVEVVSMPCWICGARAPSEAHHEPPRGMGGVRSDRFCLVPACRYCHRARHDHGLHVEELARGAKIIARMLTAEGLP